MILCCSSTQWFFFLSPILLDYIEDFSCNKIKNICNVLTLDDMHASLPDLKYRSPPSSMFHHHRVPLFAFQSFLYSFNVLAHSCASLPLKYKCSAHLGLSTMITALGCSQAWPCIQVWCCSIHHKEVEQIIHLLDSLKNCPLIGCACFTTARQKVF